MSIDSAIYVWNDILCNPTATVSALQSSGFTTAILWSVHVDSSGDLIFNDTTIISDGAWVQNSQITAFIDAVKTIKNTGSVKTLVFSVGSWPGLYNDFQNIENLINEYGTGSDTALYKNFQTLLTAIPGIDAIDFDNEQPNGNYDAPSTIAFGKMLQTIGYKSVTLCPYTNENYWISVWQGLGSFVSGVNLQIYGGGSGNNPLRWLGQFGNTPVYPGLAFCGSNANCDACPKTSFNCPSDIASRLQAWQHQAQQHSQSIQGAFIWRYEDIVQYVAKSKCPTATLSDFSNAIVTGLSN